MPQECAGEPPGLSKTGAEVHAARQQQSHAHRAAVAVQLENRFTRVRRGCREEQCESLIERLALRATKRRRGRDARLCFRPTMPATMASRFAPETRTSPTPRPGGGDGGIVGGATSSAPLTRA